MLGVKEVLSKILNWSGFRLDWSEYGTNNTTDTWVPVFTGTKLQHRVIPNNANATATKVGNYWTAGELTAYRRGNVCQLVGNPTLTKLTKRTTVAQLPAGFRPAAVAYNTINGSYEYVLVNSDGTIQFNEISAGVKWFSVTYAVD